MLTVVLSHSSSLSRYWEHHMTVPKLVVLPVRCLVCVHCGLVVMYSRPMWEQGILPYYVSLSTLTKARVSSKY